MMGVDVDTGSVPSGQDMFDSAINWILGHGTIASIFVLTIIVVGVVRALGGAAESVVGKFSVPIGIVILLIVFAGYKALN